MMHLLTENYRYICCHPTRVTALQSEASVLQHQVTDGEAIISELDSLDASLSEAADKLAVAQQEKKMMLPCRLPEQLLCVANSMMLEIQMLRTLETEGARLRVSHGLLLASQRSTTRLTPPGSPPSLSASASPSPSRKPKPVSPRRHSISFSTIRGFFDDKSSVFSSMPSSQFSSINRSSYEQFGAFLANVKEMNSHKQTKEASDQTTFFHHFLLSCHEYFETLRKAVEISGPDNKDLYAVFEGLIVRNVQWEGGHVCICI
ncbi:hypothetical protein Pfo_015984 [Paulownia fortunei]|nr:hypothetical protein Pfo_015984 [Paulownia fortunei]